MCITKSKYRLDDLNIKNYMIYQNPSDFCFGVDSVLLANFTAKNIKKNKSYIDICSGSAVIPLLVYAKTDIQNITLVEIDKDMCDMATASLKYNNVLNNFNILNEDILKLDNSLYNKFDYLSVNPPYFKKDSSIKSKDDKINLKRQEIFCSLSDVIDISSKLLKSKGSLFMVHKASRLDEIIVLLNKFNLFAKDIIMVHSNVEKKASLVLIKAVKNSNYFLDIKAPLFLYNKDNTYTKEYLNFCLFED